MTFSQDLDYWIHKTKAFLHDPPDKAIHIPGHEERSNALLDALGLTGSSLSEEEYKAADIIASGMDRATLPGYHATDDQKKGQVDFCKTPAITHPTGSDQALAIDLPSLFADGGQAVAAIGAEMQALVKKDLGDRAGSGQGLSEHPLYKGKEAAFAPARFHYLFFLLRQRLAKEDIGGLGGLWHRLPADTRLPDHSIWQHNGLVSALASCQRLGGGKASLMVFALTPVQDFVSRARKLRDYWSGSILLSWLAFEGIKAVIHELGADHILYPSLHGQPLVAGLLAEWGMTDLLDTEKETSGVASFPNKFVCLAPTGREAELAARIEEAISSAWRHLGQETRTFLEKKIKRQDSYIRQQFERQLGGYWEFHWAAAPLVKGGERSEVEELLHKDSIVEAFDFLKDSNALLIKKGILKHPSPGQGQLYSVSHRLAQAWLAAGKSQRRDRRAKEEGIKCDLFGEFEILHYETECGKNPKPSEDPFWQHVRQAFCDSPDFGNNERLCAIAMVKRLAYRVCRTIDGHPLGPMFKEAETFPSTTEMALHDWWRQLGVRAKDQDKPGEAQKVAEALACFEWQGNKDKARQRLAQWFHELNEPKVTERQGHEISVIDSEKEKSAAREIFKLNPIKDIHKYYAVLLMDGDKMGKLVNGETLGATWQSALHPDLVKRLQGDFDPDYKRFWQDRLARTRLIAPAVHAAISEALGDFSILTVPAIIEEKYQGRLIYAGGDDVCAILPAATVLDAARDIAQAYGRGFTVAVGGEEGTAGVAGRWRPKAGKLGVHLGHGEKISISAGIMIAHHKKPLGRVIGRAHELLNRAKKEGGRNAFALELDKRSGGGRLFMAGWNEEKNGQTMLDHFLVTSAALQSSEQAAMSSSLAYRLASFDDGLKALINSHPEQLGAFIAKQLDRSGISKEMPKEERKERMKEVADHVAALIGRMDGKGDLPFEALVVANFIGQSREQRNRWMSCR